MKIIIKGTPEEIAKLKKKLTPRKTLKFKSVDGHELAEYVTSPLGKPILHTKGDEQHGRDRAP